MVLVASQAVAIPAAVLLHEGQSAESYQRAFSLLQQHYPRCFNGRQVNAVMMLPFNTVYSDSVSQTLCYLVGLTHHHHLLLHRYHFLPAALRTAQRAGIYVTHRLILRFLPRRGDTLHRWG